MEKRGARCPSTGTRKLPLRVASHGAAVLVALTWFLLHRPPKASAELIQKRLTFNSSENAVLSAAISPDGKYLAYSDSPGFT